jgi:hypothetical protein
VPGLPRRLAAGETLIADCGPANAYLYPDQPLALSPAEQRARIAAIRTRLRP